VEIGKSKCEIRNKIPVLYDDAIKTLFTPSLLKVCFVKSMAEIFIYNFSAFQIFLLILCSLICNDREVTAKKIDVAVRKVGNIRWIELCRKY